MFRNVITSLFLERFRPNFWTSFSITKLITHNQIFTVFENFKKELAGGGGAIRPLPTSNRVKTWRRDNGD